MQATKTSTGSERVSLNGSKRDIRQQKGNNRRANNHVLGGAEKPLQFLHMKRVLKETILILTLSLFISLIYTAASPTGVVLLKKAFRITVSDTPEKEKVERGGASQDERK